MKILSERIKSNKKIIFFSLRINKDKIENLSYEELDEIKIVLNNTSRFVNYLNSELLMKLEVKIEFNIKF